MDRAAPSEVFFLPDEKFDFDVSLSPCSVEDDDDEVFVGPVSRQECCVSAAVASAVRGGGAGRDVQVSWSPLTGAQLEAMCQEARKLADQLQGGQPQHGPGTEERNVEDFVQGSEAKLEMLDLAARVLSPVKRETFCVQDSPMRQLPPAIQRQILRGGGTRAVRTGPTAISTASSARLSKSAASSVCKTSPRDGVKVSTRPALRVRASLGGAAVLPNRLVAPSGSGSASKARSERTRLQPQSKVPCALKRSPSSRRSASQSCEDLLSDSAGVPSHLSDSFVSSSMSEKRALAPPTKQTVGVRKRSGSGAHNRKNTSSSSSSLSSFNSSMSLSPTNGKVGGLRGSAGPAPGSGSRGRGPASGRRSLSAHSRLPEAESVKALRPSLKRADSTPTQPTPNKRPTDRRMSVRQLDAQKAPVLPTPGTGCRAAAHSDGVSSVPRPKRLMSLSSVDRKSSVGTLTPPAGGGRPLRRQPSAIPTPVRRRASAIPSPLSASRVHTARTVTVSTCSMSSARAECSASPAAKPVQEEEPADAPDIQPFCLEEEECPSSLKSPSNKPEQTESQEREESERDSSTGEDQAPDARSTGEDQAPDARSTGEDQAPDKRNGKTKEVLLLDLPAPTLQPQEKLLIDLTNTPDLIRTTCKTGSAAQLIDLSSPLIKWSPKEDEKTALLINLSF